MNELTAKETQTNRWFIIWTESRAEKRVEQRIAALGLEPWLPIVRQHRRWSDRWREVASPLFPGYLFAKAFSADWFQILRTRGVLTVVRQAGKPVLLADSYVKTLREATEREGAISERVSQISEYPVGEEVMVLNGVFRGVRGVVREWKNGRTLVIWVPEIGRGVALAIGSASVTRVNSVVGEQRESVRVTPSTSTP